MVSEWDFWGEKGKKFSTNGFLWEKSSSFVVRKESSSSCH